MLKGAPSQFQLSVVVASIYLYLLTIKMQFTQIIMKVQLLPPFYSENVEPSRG